MLSYDALCKHPAAFPSLTGLTRPEFDTLAGQFEAAERDHRRATATTRRDRSPRRNAHGAGYPYHKRHPLAPAHGPGLAPRVDQLVNLR